MENTFFVIYSQSHPVDLAVRSKDAQAEISVILEQQLSHEG